MIEFLRRLFGGKSGGDAVPTIDSPERFIGQSAAAPAPSYTPPSREELEEEIAGDMRRQIAGGYEDRDATIQCTIDIFEDEMERDEVALLAERLYPELIAEHAEAQKSWPETTDYDRLNAAFSALEGKGVIARQNFSCCGTCGSGEIWDEIEEARGAGKQAHGYAFFHMQDTESAVEGGGLYLNYGSEEEGEQGALKVAGEIVEELHSHGLKTDWDGTVGMRIGVPLDWKRRREFANRRADVSTITRA